MDNVAGWYALFGYYREERIMIRVMGFVVFCITWIVVWNVLIKIGMSGKLLGLTLLVTFVISACMDLLTRKTIRLITENKI